MYEITYVNVLPHSASSKYIDFLGLLFYQEHVKHTVKTQTPPTTNQKQIFIKKTSTQKLNVVNFSGE